MEVSRDTMKGHYYFFALWIVTALVVLGDVCNFLYAEPYCFNLYPILPFHTYPSYCRGTNRYCISMEGIFDMGEYTDKCGTIKPWIERPSELDSLCVYSVLQYAWKKDSLLMKVSLADNSTRWLLASPASSPKYKCKLQEVMPHNSDNLNGYHKITLYIQEPTKRVMDALIELLLSITYLILLFSIPILNIICLVYAFKNYDKFNKAHVEIRQKIYSIVFYVCTVIMPFVVWLIIRIISHRTL